VDTQAKKGIDIKPVAPAEANKEEAKQGGDGGE
jgi:hypothetical protein